jgi:hypothetical protein
VRVCEPEHVVDLVLAVLDGVLVHQVLGLASSTGPIEELTTKVIEPLRIEKTKRTRNKK